MAETGGAAEWRAGSGRHWGRRGRRAVCDRQHSESGGAALAVPANGGAAGVHARDAGYTGVDSEAPQTAPIRRALAPPAGGGARHWGGAGGIRTGRAAAGETVFLV